MNFSPGEARWSWGISSWKLIFILQADFWIIFLNYLMSISSYTIENTIVIPCIPSFNCVLPSKATFPLDWFLHTKTSSEVVLAPCFELQFWSDTNLDSAFCQSISSVVVTETQTILNLKRELSGFFIWEVQDYYWLQKWLDLRIQTMSPFIFPFPAFFCGLFKPRLSLHVAKTTLQTSAPGSRGPYLWPLCSSIGNTRKVSI